MKPPRLGLAAACAAGVLAATACANPVNFLFVNGSHSGTGQGSSGSPTSSPVVSLGTGNMAISGAAALDDQADPSGITVTLVDGGAKASATTGSSGTFQFTRLGAGTYTLTVSKTGYQSVSETLQVGSANLILSNIALTSPIASLTLTPASDSVYLPPESPGVSPLLPDAVSFAVTATKQDGVTEPLSAASVSFSVGDPTEATIDDSGVATVQSGATVGSLTVTAQLDGSSISGSSTVTVADPGAQAAIRILAVARPTGSCGSCR